MVKRIQECMSKKSPLCSKYLRPNKKNKEYFEIKRTKNKNNNQQITNNELSH